MNRLRGVLLTVSLAAFPIVAVCDEVTDALVVITARPAGTDHWAMGTGTIISPDGNILTAYHVIQGAKSITVTTVQSQTFKDITVSKLDTDRDLAVLHINRVDGTLPFFPVANDSVTVTPGSAAVYGHSASIYFQKFDTTITRLPIMSREVRDPSSNQEIFALRTVSLIPLQLTGVYGGLSGGPVIENGQLLGVLSGSLSEGGSIAWAIPVSKGGLSALPRVDQTAPSVTWPPLALMLPGSNLFRRAEVSLGSNLARMLDNAGALLDPMPDLLEKMERSGASYRIQIDSLLADADRELTLHPDEDVDTFTADRYKAPSWGDFVRAAGMYFGDLDSVTKQWNKVNDVMEQTIPAFKEVAEQYPDTADNEEIENKMTRQREASQQVGMRLQLETAAFSEEVRRLVSMPSHSLKDARAGWQKSREVLDIVAPTKGKGLQRRQYELHLRILTDMETIFQLKSTE